MPDAERFGFAQCKLAEASEDKQPFFVRVIRAIHGKRFATESTELKMRTQRIQSLMQARSLDPAGRFGSAQRPEPQSDF